MDCVSYGLVLCIRPGGIRNRMPREEPSEAPLFDTSRVRGCSEARIKQILYSVLPSLVIPITPLL